MLDKAEKLFEAQVRHILEEYEGEKLNTKIANAIEILYQLLEDKTAKDLVGQGLNQERIKSTLSRALSSASVKDELLDMVYTVLVGMLESELYKTNSFDELISKNSYDLVIEKIIGYEEFRHKIISCAVDSEVYAELISDVLYQGIKDYILEENFLAKMRGVSSLFKAGKWGVNKSMPKLDSMVENTVKPYIQSNIKRTISLSKTSLNRALDEKRIEGIAENTWQDFGSQPLSCVARRVDEKDVDDLLCIASHVLEDFGQSTFIVELCSQMIELWLEIYGNESIEDLLNSLGLDKDLLAAEIQAHAPHISQWVIENGYLESWIRTELKPFYESVAVEIILGSGEL